MQESIKQAMAAEILYEKKPSILVDAVIFYAMLGMTNDANIKAIADQSENINSMLIRNLLQRLPL